VPVPPSPLIMLISPPGVAPPDELSAPNRFRVPAVPGKAAPYPGAPGWILTLPGHRAVAVTRSRSPVELDPVGATPVPPDEIRIGPAAASAPAVV